MAPVVLDTNVAVVANEGAPQAGADCVLSCVRLLEDIRENHTLLLDSDGLILGEYLKQRPHGFPQNTGDLFLVWVHDNQGNPDHVREFSITPLDNDPRTFDEFPPDRDLDGFHFDDRKFVAVAIASQCNPPIFNAVDSDWWDYEIVLRRNGVDVHNICPNIFQGRIR